MCYSNNAILIIIAILTFVRGEFRIFGGSLATIEDFPYLVSIRLYQSHLCGGAIISRRYILTAAHCIYNLKTAKSSLIIRVGSTSRSYGGTIYNTSKTIVHPRFDGDNAEEGFDIGFLMLSEQLKYDSNVRPIRLFGRNERITTGTMCSVSGWGLTEKSEFTSSEQLQTVEVPIVQLRKCHKSYARVNVNITNRVLCAGYKNGGKDACLGDSGGPLVCERKLAGIVSFGYGCALPNFPGVYTKISSLRSYIRYVTGV